jgi:FkbM family methyltransferase
VDVGANVGFSTGLFADAWPQAKVIGFEMEEATADRARMNIVEFGNRVTVITAAIGWPERKEKAIISTSSPVNSLKPYDHGQGVYEIDVDVISLDRALEKAGAKNKKIDILKMDIEGAEWEVLNDGGNWSQLTSILIIEVYPHWAEFEKFKNKVKELGFLTTLNHAGQLIGYRP